MTRFQNIYRLPSMQAFTLVELLVVLAIIAVVGSGVAVTYGRKNVEEAKDRMTLHEMGEIKKAFLQFENDNYHRLQQPLGGPSGNTDLSDRFVDTFGSAPSDDDQFYQRMDFYESYGLWFLMARTVFDVASSDRDDDTNYQFPDFPEYDAQTGDGWNGPYLDVSDRGMITRDGVDFPQIADKHGSALTDADDNSLGIYRVVYFEHDGNTGGLTGQPLYRRLLLVSPRGDSSWDDLEELLEEAGSERGGTANRFVPETGSFNNDGAYDESDATSNYFIIELLNNDIHP